MKGVAENIKNSLPGKRALIKLVRTIPVLVAAIIIGFLIYQTISTAKGALIVEASQEAIVYVDAKEIGNTPVEVELLEGEYVIAVLPKTGSPTAYIAKVKVTANVKTIVRRSFGEDSGEVSAQIISFERNNTSEAKIAVVTIPDKVEVLLNGQNQGTTPLNFSTDYGEHTLELSKENYEKMTIRLSTLPGYTVTVVAELAE